MIVALGFNDNPVVPGADSALFLHVATEDFKPTKGSVALRREVFLAILEGIDACARLCVKDSLES